MEATAANSTASLDNPAPASARVGDPDTSHQAANVISPDRMRQTYKTIILALGQHGPCNDEEIMAYIPAGLQSQSGVRTRRNELVKGAYVEWAGYTKKLASGVGSRVWMLSEKGGKLFTHWTGQPPLAGGGMGGQGTTERTA